MTAHITLRVEFSETKHPVVIETDVNHMADFDHLMARSRRLVQNVIEHRDTGDEPVKIPERVQASFAPASMTPHIQHLDQYITANHH